MVMQIKVVVVIVGLRLWREKEMTNRVFDVYRDSVLYSDSFPKISPM